MLFKKSVLHILIGSMVRFPSNQTVLLPAKCNHMKAKLVLILKGEQMTTES